MNNNKIVKIISNNIEKIKTRTYLTKLLSIYLFMAHIYLAALATVASSPPFLIKCLFIKR